MKPRDLIILGLGGMGSAVAAHAAWRGLDVLGLEQYSLPHRRGSSYGITRILRLGLHEGTTYAPMVARAVELWKELGEKTGMTMFHRCGSLDIGREDSPIFANSRAGCATLGIEHEVLNARELHQRFPGFTPEEDMWATYQPGSGFVLSDVSLQAHQQLALAAGAELHGHEKVEGWSRVGELYEVATSRGRYRAKAIVVTTGAWAGKMLAPYGVPIVPERQVLGWFQPAEEPELFTPARMPVWILDAPGRGHFYGLPIFDIPGFKLAKFGDGETIDLSQPLREPDLEEEEVIRDFLRQYFPKANGPVMTLAALFFENSPDRAFIIDELPQHPNLWLAVGFSGHGYKYASAIGELMVDLVTKGAGRYDLTPFRVARFREGKPLNLMSWQRSK